MSAEFLSLSMSAVGWAQILCCFKAKRKWVRFLPLTFSIGAEGLCWGAYVLAKLLDMEDSLGYPAAMLGCVLWLWIVMALVGWAVYGIVKGLCRLLR